MKTQLPPLPLVNGALLIDNSTLEYYTTCKRSYEYYGLWRRELAGDKAALNFGQAIHEALAIRNRLIGTTTLGEIQRQQAEFLDRYFRDHPQPVDDRRSASTAIAVIEMYNREYPDDNTEIVLYNGHRLVEEPFAIPLATFRFPDIQPDPIPAFWTGRQDKAVTYQDRSLWGYDYKTTSMLGPSYFKQFSNDQGQIGYCWALQKLLGKPVQGFLIDAIKSDIAKKSDQFARHKEFLEPDRIVEWEYNTITLIGDLLQDYARGYFPMETKWCVGKYGPCQYLNVCLITRANRSTMLASNMYRDVEWSPLKETANEQRTKTT